MLFMPKFGNHVVNWHGHFLVRGVTKTQLAKHLEKLKPRFTPVMPGLCAVHKKIIPRDQFGYKLWYILKSPCKEYSIAQRRGARRKTGAVRFHSDAEIIDQGWYGVGLSPGDGISTHALWQADEAANDLARRVRAFRANPKAYSEYTHQFVHILDERWPKFDVQDHHFYPTLKAKPVGKE
jgi:hypothetical protein